MILALASLLVIGAVLVGLSSPQRHSSDAAAAEKRAARLAADARAVNGDPGAAVQLAVAAFRSAPTTDTAGLLYGLLDRPVDSVIDSRGTRGGTLRIATQAHGDLVAATSGDGYLRIWKHAATVTLEAQVHAVTTGLAFVPGRPLLAGPCPGGSLCLWNVADPRQPRVLAQLPGHSPSGAEAHSGVTSMAVSSDSTLAAAAHEDGHTLLWSIAQPTHPRLLGDLPNPARGSHSDLAAVAFSPTGDLLATTVQDGATALWDVSRPDHPASVATLGTGFQALAFSPDGNTLAAVGDFDVGLWRLDRGSARTFLDLRAACPQNPAAGGPMDIAAVAFTPDGRTLAYSGQNPSNSQNHNAELCLLDTSPLNLDSGAPTATGVPLGFGVFALAYTPDGTLVSGGPDGVVRGWRTALPSIRGVSALDSSALAVSPDNHLLAAPIDPTGSQALDGPTAFGIWDLTTDDNPVQSAVVPVRAELFSFLRPGLLLTVAHDGAVQLWDLRDPRQPRAFASLGSALVARSAAFSAEVTSDTAGDLIGVLGDDSRLHLWRLGRGRQVTGVGSVPATGAGLDVAGVLGDGRSALLVTHAGISWWDISDPAHPVPGPPSPLPGADMGVGQSAGTLFAAGVPSGANAAPAPLELFHLVHGRPASTVTLAQNIGGLLDLTDDARLLAASQEGNSTLVLWNVGDPAHPRRLAALSVPAANGIAIDSSDRRLSDWNRTTVQEWDLHDEAAPALTVSLGLPAQAPPADDRIYTVSYTPSGKRLAVATGDVVFLYDAAPADLAARLCSLAGAPLTRQQWARYAPGLPYESPCP